VGLADDILEQRESLAIQNKSKCRVRHLLGLLDSEDRKALEGLLTDPNVVGTKIVKQLFSKQTEKLTEGARKAKGAEKARLEELASAFRSISHDGLQRHRRGACSCESAR
jgi:hypothetical protein